MTQDVQKTLTAIQHFITSATPAECESFLEQTRADAAFFQQTFETRTLILPSQEHELNHWFFSPIGKETSIVLLEASLMLLAETAQCAAPGHDIRHFFKTFFSGLRFTIEDQIVDYRQYFLIGALLHDIGRLIEEKILGKQIGGSAGVDHAKLSFSLAKKLLDHFPQIPQVLKEHLLYAILMHQQGTGKPFMAQTVARCDREQLVGPEAIQRMFAFDVGLQGVHIQTTANEERRSTLPSPGTPEDTEVMHHIEFYMRNLYPAIGTQAQANEDKLKSISGIFLMLANTQSIRKQIFAPEFARDENKLMGEQSLQSKKPLAEHVWHEIKKGPDEAIRKRMQVYMQKPLPRLLEMLVTLPYASVTQAELYTLHSKLLPLTKEEKNRLQEGIAYAIVMREQLDAQEEKFLATYPKKSLGFIVLQQIQERLHP